MFVWDDVPVVSVIIVVTAAFVVAFDDIDAVAVKKIKIIERCKPELLRSIFNLCLKTIQNLSYFQVF